MFKSINWKSIFKGFAWLFCLGGMVFLMSFIAVKKQAVKCSKVEILIPGADNFIEREEIDAIIKQDAGHLIGKSLSLINIHHIEKTIKANPYIAFVKVFADMDGVISIEIKQRQPVLRVINASGQDYYIDSDGLKMPVSSNFTANVLVANGNISESFSGKVDSLFTPLAKDLYAIALYAKKDALWDAQFEQLYVNEKNDIEVIPRVGNQRILLGNAESLEIKMKNLLAFYKQAMPKVGWNAYKTINLKYINQIVCEKYDSLAIRQSLVPTTDSTLLLKKAVDSVVTSAIKAEIGKATAANQNIKTINDKPAAKEPQKTTKASDKQEKIIPTANKPKETVKGKITDKKNK